jgi:hypothetical protein
MYPADTNYAQETVESPLWWWTQNHDISAYITYMVFGDAYVGDNDFIVLYQADPSVVGIDLFGSFPGPGTFDN